MDRSEEKKEYTVDDIYALPEGTRAELTDGQIYYMSPPSRTHQRISGYLHNEIYNFIRDHKGDCEVYAAPFAVFLNDDDTNYYEPDISVICDLSKLDEKGCHGAPDWIIEIVSPTSRPRDSIKKMLRYGTAGVREYWIVDPEKQTVTVYEFEREKMKEYVFSQEIPVGLYTGFTIRMPQY